VVTIFFGYFFGVQGWDDFGERVSRQIKARSHFKQQLGPVDNNALIVLIIGSKHDTLGRVVEIQSDAGRKGWNIDFMIFGVNDTRVK